MHITAQKRYGAGNPAAIKFSNPTHIIEELRRIQKFISRQHETRGIFHSYKGDLPITKIVKFGPHDK